jgi:hypothetical protein
MTCGRKLYGNFEDHAGRFAISYENLVRSGQRTAEEREVLGQAYYLISQMRLVPKSQWHEDEIWFGFAQTVTQRLDSATSRALQSTTSLNVSKIQTSWIPESHPLFRAEEFVYYLCTLFTCLASIRTSDSAAKSFLWVDTADAIEYYLNDLAQIVFCSSPSLDIQDDTTCRYLLSIPLERWSHNFA